MTQDIQALRQGLPTLHNNDLICIVKARTGWFHPDVVTLAREELDRRGAAIPPVESSNDRDPAEAGGEADDRILPSWFRGILFWFGYYSLRDLLHVWLPPDWSAGLSTLIALMIFYALSPVQNRRVSLASWLPICVAGGE